MPTDYEQETETKSQPLTGPGLDASSEPSTASSSAGKTLSPKERRAIVKRSNERRGKKPKKRGGWAAADRDNDGEPDTVNVDVDGDDTIDMHEVPVLVIGGRLMADMGEAEVEPVDEDLVFKRESEWRIKGWGRFRLWLKRAAVWLPMVATGWLAGSFFAGGSDALCAEMAAKWITTPETRDLMSDDMVDEAERLIEEETGNVIEPLE